MCRVYRLHHARRRTRPADPRAGAARARRRDSVGAAVARAVGPDDGNTAPSGSQVAGPTPGRLLWPIDGTITSPFGPRWGRLHAGLDIGAPEGTPIKAADAGRVVLAGPQGAYDLYTCIQHSSTLSSCYAHQVADRHLGRRRGAGGTGHRSGGQHRPLVWRAPALRDQDLGHAGGPDAVPVSGGATTRSPSCPVVVLRDVGRESPAHGYDYLRVIAPAVLEPPAGTARGTGSVPLAAALAAGTVATVAFGLASEPLLRVADRATMLVGGCDPRRPSPTTCRI